MTQLPSACVSEASGCCSSSTTAEEVAKRIESHLRNAGHPLAVAWITDLEDLQDVLQRNPPDLVLCDENARKAPTEKVIGLVNQLAPGPAGGRDQQRPFGRGRRCRARRPVPRISSPTATCASCAT